MENAQRMKIDSLWFVTRIVYRNSVTEDRAETLVEGLPLFYRDSSGKATRRHCESIEEPDAAEDEAIAVPVRDDPTGACHSM